MAHNAGTVNAVAITEQTTLELNDLIGGTLTGGNVLIAQGGGAWTAAPVPTGGDETRGAALTATAPGTGTDPAVASNSAVRSYPFYINAGQNLNTNGVTYLGSESVFGAEWNTQFRIDTAGVWLIVAQLPFNQTAASTAYYSITITTALTGTGIPPTSTTQGPLYTQKLDQYKRPGLYAAVLNITSVPFSFRFAYFNAISVVRNMQPSRAQLQYLEITRLA